MSTIAILKEPASDINDMTAVMEILHQTHPLNGRPAPPISETTAILLGLTFTIFYVAPFYISPTLRTTPLNSRDSPTVISARIRAVLLSCLASTLLTVAILITYAQASPQEILRLFGIHPINPFDILSILTLLAILFAGPLYEHLLIDSAWKSFNIDTLFATFWTSPTSHRNLVIAPWCEELVFRSLVIALYLLTGTSPARIIFTSPLIFGVAHIHHLVENLSSRTPPGRTFPSAQVVIMVLVMSVFQFAYTSLFGFFAAFVFLRTGNVFAAVAAHTFCNWMGLPRVWGRVGEVEMQMVGDITPYDAQGKQPASSSSRQKQMYRPRYVLGMGWTVVYYILLVGGAYGFHRTLWMLTESGNALVAF